MSQIDYKIYVQFIALSLAVRVSAVSIGLENYSKRGKSVVTIKSNSSSSSSKSSSVSQSKKTNSSSSTKKSSPTKSPAKSTTNQKDSAKLSNEAKAGGKEKNNSVPDFGKAFPELKKFDINKSPGEIKTLPHNLNPAEGNKPKIQTLPHTIDLSKPHNDNIQLLKGA